ncbi:MAG: acyl-CoA dehydrogenase family protein [Alphaproteobacteria bacterium]
MRIEFTSADKDVRARARELTEKHLYPHEVELDENDRLPPEVEAAIKRAVLAYGLNAVNHGKEDGGQGLSIVQQMIVNEEVGKSTGALWVRVWLPPMCLKDASPEQKRRYLRPACAGDIRIAFNVSEPGAGSDAGGIRTSAVLKGNTYVINGEKCFASGAEHVEAVLLHVNVDGDAKKPTLFIVDPKSEGFVIKRLPRFMQRSGHGHPEVEIRNLKVPAEQILGTIGQGFELTKDWFVEARLAIAARSIGMAIRATELANAHAATRHQFGRPIRDFQAIEFMIAEMATEIMAGKSMIYRVAAEIDAALDRKAAHAKVSAIKLYCSEAGWRVVDKALQIFGGRGAMCENPVERLYRDVRLERIWEGTSEIQKVIIGGQIRKRGLDAYLGWS